MNTVKTVRTIALFALPLILVLLFFRESVFLDRQFAFRDAAHFYHPLDAYIDQCRLRGEPPDWLPYENFGQPLAACPTSAVFYPLKMFRPLLGDSVDADWVYVCTHLLIATATLYRLARHFGCSRFAALFGGLAYAFGGSVLYQYANPPFLVGAAWFPEAFRQTDKLFRRRRVRNVLGTACVVAMMVLGGDAQAAYHAGLLALALLVTGSATIAVGKLFRSFHRSGQGMPGIDSRSFFKPALLLGIAFAFAVLLAAVQILPALEFTRISERQPFSAIRSPAMYNFSVPPIRLTEFLWPNIGGFQFPINSRWFSAWGTDLWVPSLYMGLLPLFLALTTLRLGIGGIFRRIRFFALLFKRGRNADTGVDLPTEREFAGQSSRGTVFLSWFAVVALLCSLGEHAVFYDLVARLPGYTAFRYPGKWTTVCAMPLAVLAARGFDRVFRDENFRRRFQVLLLLFCLTSFPLALLAPIARSTALAVAPCPVFGPCDPDSAARMPALAACHVFLVAGAVLLILRRSRGAENRRKKTFRKSNMAALRNLPLAALLLLSGIDLYAANSWMVATCERDAFLTDSPIRREILRRHRRGTDVDSNADLPVIYRCPWWSAPPSFATGSSSERLAENVRWQTDTLFPKFHMSGPESQRLMAADVRGTMMSVEYFRRTNAIRVSYRDGKDDFEDRLMALGVQWVVVPVGRPLNPAKARSCPVEGAPEDAALWELLPEIGAGQNSGSEIQRPGYDAQGYFHRVADFQKRGLGISLGAFAVLVTTVVFLERFPSRTNKKRQ